MSLLNPVLLPPQVKAYLSHGERFIKWDDVSGAGLWAAGTRGAGRAARCFPRVVVRFMSVRTRAPVWLGLAADTTVWINKPGGEGVYPKHTFLGFGAKTLCLDVRSWEDVSLGP